MRVAALYDIHGNLPALHAVLAEVRAAGVDRVVVGGDVVPGPMPRAALARLRELDVPVDCIVGNGERKVVRCLRGEPTPDVPERFRPALRWSAEELEAADVNWIESWPETLRLAIAGLGEVLFCHATPQSDREIFLRTTPVERLLPVFAGIGAGLVVCGHTHMQFDRLVGSVRVVNAGSVGMPFDGPGAAWLLLGPAVELRRTVYDRERAALAVRATHYPQAEEFAASSILDPPSEAETLVRFAGVELA